MEAKAVTVALRHLATPARAKALSWFFKSGPGEYGEGDQFIGVTVPQVRQVVKQFRDLSLAEIEKLVTSPWHEERLAGLLMLVNQFVRGSEQTKKTIYDFYISHTRYVNNWDLVDMSAEFIIGPWLDSRPEKLKVLKRLGNSSLLWERRIALLASFDYIKKGRAEEALILCEQLLYDKHDLIQKATGWMLREVGKRVGVESLKQFLDRFAATMPRTTLRYAIERFGVPERAHYLSLAKNISRKAKGYGAKRY